MSMTVGDTSSAISATVMQAMIGSQQAIQSASAALASGEQTQGADSGATDGGEGSIGTLIDTQA